LPKCDICKKNVKKLFKCKYCGAMFCENCGDYKNNICKDCKEYETAQNEKIEVEEIDTDLD